MQKSKLQIKIKNFLLKHWPFLFILTLWFTFSFPYFLQGKVPYPSTYQVNHFTPWSHYQEFWGPVKNGAMPDIVDQIYPWKKFTVETLKGGELPLWNPYNFSGNPHLANFQSAVLTPFNLLFFIFSLVDAWSILVLLQPLLAGIFTYLFVREIGVGRVGTLISSISFMFSGFIVVWMAYGTLAYSILYLPLALFAVEKYFKTKKFIFLLVLSLAIPFSFFSGHFQISFYFIGTIIAYIVFKGLIARNILNIFYITLAVILGLVLSLPQIIPSIQFYLHAIRSEIFQISEAIPLEYLITFVAPDFFGNPVTRNDWFGHYAEWASFIGVLPFTLAVIAIFKVRTKTVVFFAVLGFVSLILAANSPISQFIISLKIPVISTSALSRIIVLFSFSVAVLAGFGFDRLIRKVGPSTAIRVKKVRELAILFGVIGIFFALVWGLLFFGNVYPDEWLIVAKRNFVLPTMLFLGAVFFVALALKEKRFIILLIVYFLLLSLFDSLRFASKWMPFDPKDLVFADLPVINGIQKNIGDGRIYGNLGAEVTTYYGFQSLEGYDPLYIGRYGEFIRSAGSGEFTEGERSVVKLERLGKYTDRVLDLLGVSLIFHPIADTNQSWAYPVWEDKERFSLVYEDDKFQLFKNNLSFPRAALFFDYDVIGQDREIIKRFYSDDFDFRNVLILEEDPNLKVEEQPTGSAKIVSYTPNKIVIEAITNSPALLFLSDNHYPGWKATVNGDSSKIYRADYSFRSVIVPKGESVVEFEYSLL